MSDEPRDEAAPDAQRASLRRDVLEGFEQLARGEGRLYDASSSRELAEDIKAYGRVALAERATRE